MREVSATDKETDESWDIHIYNMKNQLWAGLGSRAVIVKKSLGPIMSNFWGPVFYVFMGKKNKFNLFFENIVASALKSEKLHE